MPATRHARQKRRSTETENDTPSENVSLPAKLRKSDKITVKKTSKKVSRDVSESVNKKTYNKKEDSKSLSESKRKRKKQDEEASEAPSNKDISENPEKISVTKKRNTKSLNNADKDKVKNNAYEKKCGKKKKYDTKTAESVSHDSGDVEITNKGDNYDAKCDSDDSDDDFLDVGSNPEDEIKVASQLSNINVKPGKKVGAKKIRKTSVSGEEISRKVKKCKTKKKETESNCKAKSNILKAKRVSKKEMKPSKDTENHQDLKSHIKLMKEDDVAKVLMQMEGCIGETDGPQTMDCSSSSKEEMDSNVESDWEEVADHPAASKSQIPSGPVQVRLELPDIMKKKRKRKAFDKVAFCRRLINRFERNCLIQLHKTHMLCLLSHGLHCSRICQSSILQAQALSLVPTDILKKRRKSYDIQSIVSLTRWFVGLVVIDPDHQKTSIAQSVLVSRFSTQKVSCGKELVLLFFSLLTVLGLDARIVFSLQPLPWKTTGKDSQKTADRNLKSKKSPAGKIKDGKNKSKDPNQPSCSGMEEVNSDKKCKKVEEQTSKYFKESQNLKLKGKLKKGNQIETKKNMTDFKRNNSKSNRKKDKSKDDSTSGGKKETSTSKSKKGKTQAKNSRRRTCASKLSTSQNEVNLSEESEDESEGESGDSDYSNYSDDEQRGKKAQKKKSKTTKPSKKRKTSSQDLTSTSDLTQDSTDEFEEENTTFRKSPSKTKVNKTGHDWWIEVFLESEEKWICVDVNKPETMEKLATHPICYVIAFDNHGCVKDVTSRYASQWMSHTRKLRVDIDWWEEAIDPYRSPNTKQDQLEDLVLKAEQMKKPLPQVIGEYKNHPLYALHRHLLKFEAIYPATAVPLGFVRNEPVYARECVHTLHSRDNWLKEGRVVKLGMTAYKMVKSRPKMNKPKEKPDELDLEVFGEWQTDIYVPPPAENGKIYKNEYGNIELFKPSMLPAGTVHIRIEGLKRVAKKLDIDCVPAMVGWDHHSGFAHPILDGFVVCNEHEDILLSAWEEDQELQRQREILKKQKRVYGNWKIFVRGLLIKERLKKRFDLENASHGDKPESKTGSDQKATDTEISWPRNRLNKTKTRKTQKPDYLVEVEEL